MDELVNVLSKFVSPDENVLRNVETFLQQAAQNNLGAFLTELSNVISKPDLPVHIRTAAGLQFKNQLTSKDPFIKTSYQQRWLLLPANIKECVKQNVVKAISLEGTRPSAAAQCAAYIAVAEMPNNLWPELTPYLVHTITDTNSTVSAIEGSLEALGYICQEIDPRILHAQSNEILTAIIHGMKNENSYIKHAATTALFNSLEFTSANFNHDNERNYIMQVVCEATQSLESNIQVCALQCLVKIMSLYYQYMEIYMREALFAITVGAMKNTNDDVALQGIEFWSTVCDEEIEMNISECAEEAKFNNLRPNVPEHIPLRINKNYAKGALPFILPILLETLTKQDENADEDEWNPYKAASVCLMLLADCCGNDIVQSTLEFITPNIFNNDWRFREGAVMAFGCIMNGPTLDILKTIVEQALPHIVPMIKDPVPFVRDTVSWAIGRICEFVPEVVLTPNILNPLLNALVENLSAEPKIAVNICWSLSSLVESAYDRVIDYTIAPNVSPDTFLLSSQYEIVVERLLVTAERNDAGHTNLKGAAYVAISDWLKCCPLDCYYVLHKMTTLTLERLKQVIQMVSSSPSNANNESHYDSNQMQLMELQSHLCSVLQSALRKLKVDDLTQISDTLMAALLQILSTGSGKSSTCGVQEDILMTVSALIEGYGDKFVKYMDAFLPFLLRSILFKDIYQVSVTAIMVTMDLYRNLKGVSMFPFTERIINVLIQLLADPNVEKTLKPHIFSCIGEVALALGPSFAPFAPSILQTIDQASKFKLPTSIISPPIPPPLQNQQANGLLPRGGDSLGAALANGVATDSDGLEIDESMIDFMNTLRSCCIEAYTGIINGLSSNPDPNINPTDQINIQNNPQIHILEPYIGNMIQFVTTISTDIESSESLLITACTLIGDLCNVFGQNMKQFFDNNSPYSADLNKFFERVRGFTRDKTQKKSINWALRRIKLVKNTN